MYAVAIHIQGPHTYVWICYVCDLDMHQIDPNCVVNDNFTKKLFLMGHFVIGHAVRLFHFLMFMTATWQIDMQQPAAM